MDSHQGQEISSGMYDINYQQWQLVSHMPQILNYHIILQKLIVFTA